MNIENRGGTFVMTGASGYTLEAQYMAGPLLCAWLCVARFRWQALLILIPYVAYRSYAGMSRWTFVLLFVALALAYAWEKRTKWFSLRVLAMAIPVMMLFNYLGNNRNTLQNWLAGRPSPPRTAIAGISWEDQFRDKYDGPDFANFDFLTYVVSKVPERSGMYTYGGQYVQLFTEPIPRALWPGKPAGSPIKSFNLNSYGNFIGRTVSLVGDGWMSGGWAGVIITTTIVGALLGWAHRWFWAHANHGLWSLIYLMGIAMLVQWFRDGGISIAKFIFWNISPLVIWQGLSWMMGPRVIPGYSVLLPRGASYRLVRAGVVTAGMGEKLMPEKGERFS
jgi:O-antigen polysaccharide polymerase Wzy